VTGLDCEGGVLVGHDLTVPQFSRDRQGPSRRGRRTRCAGRVVASRAMPTLGLALALPASPLPRATMLPAAPSAAAIADIVCWAIPATRERGRVGAAEDSFRK